MKLLLKYTRKDFFGNDIYSEDYKHSFTKNDLVKAFLFFSKTQDTIIQTGSVIMYWDGSKDFKNKTVSVRYIEKENVSGGIIPFEMLKKAWYGKFRKQVVA